MREAPQYIMTIGAWTLLILWSRHFSFHRQFFIEADSFKERLMKRFSYKHPTVHDVLSSSCTRFKTKNWRYTFYIRCSGFNKLCRGFTFKPGFNLSKYVDIRA